MELGNGLLLNLTKTCWKLESVKKATSLISFHDGKFYDISRPEHVVGHSNAKVSEG